MFGNKILQSSLKFQRMDIRNNLIVLILFLMKFMFGIPIIITLIDNQEQEASQKPLGILFSEFIGETVSNQKSILTTLLSAIIILESTLYYLAFFGKNHNILKFNFLSILIFQTFKFPILFVVIKIFSDSNFDWVLNIISVILLLSNAFRDILIYEAWVSFSFSNKNKFSHRPNRIILFLSIIEQIMFAIRCYFTFEVSSQYGLKIADSIDLVFCVLMLIKGGNFLFKLIVCYFGNKFYLDFVSEILESYLVSGSLFILLMKEITDIVFEVTQVMIKGSEFIALTISLFALTSFFVYQQHKQSSTILKNYQEIKKDSEILSFLQCFYQLFQHKETKNNELIMISLYKEHTFKCNNPSCYCHQIENYKKHRFQQDSLVFLKLYLQDASKNFLSLDVSLQLELLIISFQLQLFKDFLNASRHLKNLKLRKKNNLKIQIGIQQLQQKILTSFNFSHSNKENLKFQSPILLNELLAEMKSIIKNDIYIKNRKWRYLCSHLVKSLQIQEDVVKQISLISRFQQIFTKNQETFQKSLPFNCLSLFYYGEIVFLQKQLPPIEKNLAKIKQKTKKIFLNTSKDILKNIFDQKCTVLSINLSQEEVNQSFNYKIKNCDRNVQSVFKINRNKLINKKLSEIYPQFLRQQNQKILFEFSKGNNKINQQKITQNFFIDFNGNLFKANQYLKIITKEDGIYMLIVLYKNQFDNLMIINNEKMIENVGSDFVKYFGLISSGIPLQTFFCFQKDYEQFQKCEKQNRFNFSFIYGTEIGKQWILYLQKIKSLTFENTQKQQKRYHTSNTNNKLKNSIKNKKENSLIEIKKEFIRKQVFGIDTFQTNNVFPQHTTSPILNVFFTSKMHTILDKNFQVLEFQQFKRKKPTKNQKKSQLSQKSQKDQKISNENCQKDDDSTHQQLSNDEKDQLSIQKYSQDGKYTQDSFQQQKQNQNKKQIIKNQRNNKNIKSSINGEALSYFYRNFIQICLNLFRNPQQIHDKRLNKFIVISIFLSIMFCFLVVATYVLFDLSFYEIRDIFQADGAVSDNMQLSQFMYNRAMNFKQHQKNTDEMRQISQSSAFESGYLMSLVKEHVEQFEHKVTKMTNTKFYQYLTTPIIWHSFESDDPSIQSGHMINSFYHLMKEVQKGFTSQQQNQIILSENALTMMKDNFPSIKKINHESLSTYKKMSTNGLNLIDKFVYILGAIHIFLSILSFQVFQREKIFRRKQQMQSYTIYKLIPKNIIEILSKYYQEKVYTVVQNGGLKKYEKLFEMQGIQLPADPAEYTRANNSGFITNNFKSPLAIWKVFGMILSLNVLYFIFLIQVQQLSEPISQMMTNVNDLIDSQNYLLEAYFDLKAKFIVEETKNINQQFLDLLMSSQQSMEVIFNKISVESIQIFKNYDSTYQQDFVNLLISDVCDLGKNQFSQKQFEKCKNMFEFSILQNGVIMGMNFFTRKVKETILMLKQKINKEGQNGSLSINPQQMQKKFMESDFLKIDESIFFMFKIYQATQNRIYTSLQKMIVNLLNMALILFLIQVFVMGLCYPMYLVYSFKNEKIELSKIYMSFLLIPTPVSRMIKAFAGKIQLILQYDRNNS